MTTFHKESGFIFPEKLVDKDSYTAKYYNELLRGLTHKLNNLLAVIQGFSSLVLMQEGLDEMSKENVQHMKDAGTTASSLGERILPAGGCSRVDISEMDLRTIAPMLESRLRTAVEKHSLMFSSNIASELPLIRGDKGKLREILDALVTNACEAAEPRGEVSLDILPPGQVLGSESNCVDIFVRNTGSAIPEDKLLEIFKPFYTTKDNVHLGIGLTTAYVSAGQMNMDLGVRSERGTTTFWLRVPMA